MASSVKTLSLCQIMSNSAGRLVAISVITLMAMLPGRATADPQAKSGESPAVPRLQASSNRVVAAAKQGLSPSASAPKEGTNVSLPAGVGQDWWSTVQKNLAAAEYNVARRDGDEATGKGGAFQAPNRTQGFRTTFEPAGIRIAPRTEEQASWQWGLELTGYGWNGDVRPVERAEPRVNENRVEYARKGLVEWYVNDPRGLEQGFTLDKPARDNEAADPSKVVVELALRGGLAAYPSEDGQSIEFASGSQRVLRYAELKVTDAMERVLPARIEVCSTGSSGPVVQIVVETNDVVWPIIVDPLATSPSWTAEGNQNNGYFGYSVASAGDVNGDGYADIIIGAYEYDNVEIGEGKVFVYHGSASGLELTAAWTAESNQAGAQLGYSVASAGDVNGDGYADVVVGAPMYDNVESNEGWAFVWLGSASGVNSDIDGTPANAAWRAESNQSNAFFGGSVASAGDVNGDDYADVIIGACLYDNPSGTEGRAYVYHGSASGLSLAAGWKVEGDGASSRFGYSVASAGDVNGDGYADVIVGAWRRTVVVSQDGRVFVYHGSASGLSTTAAWTADGDQVSSRFGYSVASAGDVNGDGYSDVVVGAYYYDIGENQEGVAFVWHGSATGLNLGVAGTPSNANRTLEINLADAYFGYSVASAGDVDGDGYADLIVGAYHLTNGESAEGRAYVYLGSSSGLAATAAWTAEGNQGSAYFGWSVASAGDVNGDGYADVIVGAPNYDNVQTQEGAAFVYYALHDHTLTVTRAGTGVGTVTSSPSGISCGNDCTSPYNLGTNVTLTAHPATGSLFNGWSGGGCSGTGTCVVSMTQERWVTATFSPIDCGVSVALTPGQLDPCFAPELYATRGIVMASAVQGDGKVVIAGRFGAIDGTVQPWIARVNADGTRDTSFNPGSGPDLSVSAIAIQADGKILIGGYFTSVNGIPRDRLARLNADGTLDLSFDAGDIVGNYVLSIAIQSDGKILIGGMFTAINATARSRIARFETDGDLDTTFDPGTGAGGIAGPIRSIVVQSNGKILVGGDFTTFNSASRSRIVRLESSGAVDTTFDPGTGANGLVRALALQADGNILIGGDFTAFNGTGRIRIARLTTSGAVDTSFDPGSGLDFGVISIVLQTDGKILIGGSFTTYNGTSRFRVARLATGGALDSTFDPAAGPNSTVYCLTLQTDEKIIIGGAFTTINGSPMSSLGRLDTSGALDTSFTPNLKGIGIVYALSARSNGRSLVGGIFNLINGTTRNNLARLLISGDPDNAFGPGSGPDRAVQALRVHADDSLAIGGQFFNVDGAPRNAVARLYPDGSVDTAFDPGEGPDAPVAAVAIQSDGKILIGGYISSVDGTTRNGLARLNADGTLDTTFPGLDNADDNISSFALQPDGKILIGGWFTQVGGTPRRNIARLNTDGSLDTTFDPGTGADSAVADIAMQPDGKIVIVGYFMTVNGVSRYGIARLNANGSLDATFDPGTGTIMAVFSLALQPNGRIVIAGDFDSFNGVARNRIARLNSNGSLDTTFDPGAGANGKVFAVSLQPDGKVVIGGEFFAVDGATRWGIARLAGDNFGVTVSKSGTGTGTVTSTPAGIDCGMTCTAPFAEDSAVTLTATPSLWSGFAGWSGDCAGLGACVLTMDQVHSVSAAFTACTFTLVPTNASFTATGGTGSISVTTPGVCAWTAISNDLPWLTVTSGSSGTGNGTVAYSVAANTGAARTGTITIGNQTFTVNQALSHHGLAVNKLGAGIGTVTSAPAGITCGATCAASFDYNTPVTLSAVAQAGSIFSGWSGGGCSGTGTCVVTVTQSKWVTATFAPDCGSPITLAPGQVDPCYVPEIKGSGSSVYAVTIDGDGKIIIGGSFTTINGALAPGIARLNPNGTLDESFNTGLAPNSTVYAIVFQTDGKILIGGYFTSLGGVPHDRLARLLPDGSIDLDFNPVIDNGVNEIVLQPDGKILIGGEFSHVDGTSRSRIARLFPDGTLDTSFDPGSGANSTVYAVTLQPDGKIVIGGYFTTFNGTARGRIARLDATGALDTTFDPGSGADQAVQAIALLGDGRMLVGGDFTMFASVSHNRIVRLLASGAVDTTFNPGTGANGRIFSLELESDGKALLAGEFTQFNGIARVRMARIGVDGALDESFDPGSGFSYIVWTIRSQTDGQIIAGGSFNSVAGHAQASIARLSNSGAFDTTFTPTLGKEFGTVWTQESGTDGRSVIGGQFYEANGVSRVMVAGLNQDGSTNTAFGLVGVGSVPFDIVFQADGKVIIAGPGYVVRRNSNGTSDPTFTTGTINSAVQALAIQTDGKVLIGGRFTSIGGVARGYFARLNADGALDTTFAASTSSNHWVFAVALQQDGKALVGGVFSTVGGLSRNCIARLNTDGTLDTTFDPGTGANITVEDIAVQGDGKILIVGNFTSFNGAPRNRIARLNTNGSLDTTFDPGTGVDAIVNAVMVQPNGRVLIGGAFTSLNGTPSSGIARLNADGSLDTTFDPGTGARGLVRSIALQPDGGVLIGGDFKAVNGTTRWGVARLGGDNYGVSVTKTGTGSGTVTSAPAGIDCGTSCTAPFAAGSVVTLTAVAASGSNFAGWTGEGCSGIGACQVTVDQVRTVNAMFNVLTPTGFYPVTPCRVFDTRDGTGAPILAGLEHRNFAIIGKCLIPSDAKAIVANVTVVNGSVVGNMSIIAGNLTSTITTTIEIPLARARANNATIQLATDGVGDIKVINNSTGTVHLILDVNGYFK